MADASIFHATSLVRRESNREAADNQLKSTLRSRVKSNFPIRICVLASMLLAVALLSAAARADNKVMGEVHFIPATKTEKSAGVWIDGQYVGYIDELKGNKKVLLLPGEHEITFRQSGCLDWTQKITVQPGQSQDLQVKLEPDPRIHYSEVTAEVKLKVEPDRAAVFLDGAFVGTVHEFGGLGRAMLVNPGKHQIKIALVGYQDFTTELNLRPNQKFTLKTNLIPGSVSQADPSVKKD